MHHFIKKFDRVLAMSDNVSKEVIAYQKDDEFTTKLEQYIEEIGFTHTGEYKQLISFNDMKTISAKIGELISKRTGMNITIIPNKDGMLATYPIILDISSVLYNHAEQEANDLEDMSRLNEDELKDADEMYKAAWTYSKNIKEGLKDKRLQDLAVDLDKARIYNLPNSYVGTIFLDYYYLSNSKATVREVAAVLLHEVGHNFTSIELSYRTVYNTSVIVDSVVESVKKGKSPNTGMIKAYEKLYKEKIPADTPLKNVLLSCIEIENKVVLGNQNDKNWTIDSERVADLFASRFGYGADLVSCLSKYGILIGNIGELFNHSILSSIAIGSFYAAAWTSILSLLGVTASFLLVQPAMIIFVITYFLKQLKEYDDNVALTYDGAYNRFLKMKLDAIRIIRNTPDLEDKYRKNLLACIDNIDSILKKYQKPSESLFLKLHKLISTKKQRLFDIKRSEQLIEQLQENELHVASSKLKQYL